MLESSAELPTGILENGNYHAEGLFDECLSVHSVPERVKGQYCTLYFNLEPTDQSEMIYDEFESSSPGDLTIGSPLSSTKLMANTLSELFGLSVVDNHVTVRPKISGASMRPFYFNYPSMSLCLPSSCSASDLAESVGNLIGQFNINNQSIVTISDESFCFSDDRDQPAYDGPDVAVM